MDYGAYGVILMLIMYIFRNNKIKLTIFSILIIIFRFLELGWEWKTGVTEYTVNLAICTMISLIFILLYNGNRGPKSKWFFYWFYPIHIAMLYILSPYTFNLLNL